MNDMTARPDKLSLCRACGSDDLVLFLPMGAHPPANMFVAPDQRDAPQPSFQLNTQACLGCGLIQVADQIPAGFYEHYLYVPSAARAMHDHFAGLADALIARAEDGLIVDIGCNDGLMLGFARKEGAKVLGIDPAANLAETARDVHGVDVHVAYFSPETADEVRAQHGPAKVISTTNTLNHIDDLVGFMAGIDRLMAEDGWFVIELPWGLDILEKNEFDNVYHEHLSEMSLLSLVKLAERTGMRVVDVTRLPAVHGGSMRVFIRRASVSDGPSAEVTRMLAEEAEARMCDAATYEDFAARVEGMRTDLCAMLRDLRAQGASIAGYGAPAKGNTLLNYFEIGPDMLDFLADRSTLKQGLLSPGQLIPVVDPAEIATRKPDYLLVLAWNFFDEIRTQLADYEAAGGRFILPLPHPHIVG